MYFIQDDDRELGVKPMNCPGHCVLYAAQVHSYRELPLRYADFGRLHRFERSGTLHGLTRVRSFSQDDAHIYCTLDQVTGEIARFIEMMHETYAAFGLGEPRFTLVAAAREAHRQRRAAGTRAEGALRDALASRPASQFEEVASEGAFYGPKIDLFMDDVLGREWQLGTFQLDFNMPERFDLHYAAEDGPLQRPVMIHRAILGSIERFLGVLIEHTAGAFPTLARARAGGAHPDRRPPRRVRREVRGAALRAAGLRVEVDARASACRRRSATPSCRRCPTCSSPATATSRRRRLGAHARQRRTSAPRPSPSS